MNRKKILLSVIAVSMFLIFLLGSAHTVRAAGVTVQLGFCLDGSSSITSGEWTIIKTGVADGISRMLPHDGSLELTVVEFGYNTAPNVRVIINATIVNATNYASIAGNVYALTQGGDATPMADGLVLTWNTMKASSNFATASKHIINIATDGIPDLYLSIPPLPPSYPPRTYANDVTWARDQAVSEGLDELDAEAIGSSPDILWMRDKLVCPQPGTIAPPFKAGWVQGAINLYYFDEAMNSILPSAVHLESEQDNVATSNLGTITFGGKTYSSLPTDFSLGQAAGITGASFSPAMGYVFDHWETTSGISVSSTTANPTTVTVSSPGGTLRAVYTSALVQLTVVSAQDSPSPSGTTSYNPGTSVTASVTSPVGDPAGTQYVCTGWTGTGDVPASGTDTTVTFTITQDSSITWTWTTQYWVTYAANVPVTLPASEWVVSGQPATGSFASPQYNLAGDTKYVFVSDDRPASITGPTTITATYDMYYNVIFDANVPVTVPPDEWVISGGSATGTFASPQYNGAGDTRYIFVSDNRPSTITAPTTITATYDTYYSVHYVATGNANPITVPGDQWVNSGSPATGTFPLQITVDDARDTFVSDNRPPTITAPTTITGTYHTSYLVTYAANIPVTLPASEWVLSGQPATGTFTSPVISDGTEYVFVSDDRPSTITAPTTITATYDTYYNVHYAANVAVSVPGDEWVKSGQAATGSFASPQYNLAGDTKYVFVSDDRPSTITAPTTVTATYKTQYMLTVSTSPIVSPLPTVTLVSGYYAGGGWYEAGSVVHIDPNSPVGYTFDHWSGDAAGSTVPLSVTMTSAKNIVAVYKFYLAVETGFKPGDSPSFASDLYLTNIMCVLAKTTGGYRLVGTSPGTFDYAISIKNPGATTFSSITIAVTGHKDFCLKSSNPIRVLDANGVDITSQFTISGTWPTITISSNTLFTGLQGSKALYATIHLEYALKGNVFTSQFYSKGYTFHTTVSGTSGPNSGTNDAYGSVMLLSKKTTIIYGYVRTSSGSPIPGAKVKLYAHDGTLLNTDTTDADGFFCFVNGVNDENNKAVSLSGGVTYTLKVTLPDTTLLGSNTVIAQTETAVMTTFTK